VAEHVAVVLLVELRRTAPPGLVKSEHDDDRGDGVALMAELEVRRR
jgi:hypothetical protein